jgi:hypothetical protein
MKPWLSRVLIALSVAVACAKATDERLLGDDDDHGGESGGGFGGTGFGGTGFGGTATTGGRGGTTSGGTTGIGGAQGGTGATSGTGGTGGSDGGVGAEGGEGGTDPCMVVGTPPDVRVDYKEGARPLTDEPGGEIHLNNQTTAEVPLNEVTLRYWFTSEFACAETTDEFLVTINDFRFQMTHVEKMKSDVTIKVVGLEAAGTGCDAYFELGFLPAAGSLEPGQYAAISYHSQLPIYTRTHSQANDYSYGACTTTHVYWEKITVYRSGRLVAGVPPNGVGGEGGAGGESSGGMGGV